MDINSYCMKKTLILILSSLFLCTGHAQNAIKLPSGDYSAIGKKDTLIITGKVYTDKDGMRWAVFLTSKGKLYIIRQSKRTGKRYRSYLKLQ